MVELENARTAALLSHGGGATTTAGGATGGATSSSAAEAASAVSKSGLLRVVRIGAGNFAAVPGMEQHQGSLIAYLLMQAFIINLRRNSVTTVPTAPNAAPAATLTPTAPKASLQGQGHGHGGRQRSTVPASAATAAAAAATAAAPAPAPVTTSLYKNLSVVEFIFFDEDLCPVPLAPVAAPVSPTAVDGASPSSSPTVLKRMVGGVELRFSRSDVLELRSEQLIAHHVGILAPADSFSLPGNEEGYTSLSAMMGNNTSLRLHQCFHYNPHILAQHNYVPVELAPELIPHHQQQQQQQQQPHHTTAASVASATAELWSEHILPVLTSDKSPSPWLVAPPQEFDTTEE
jgi:hypothetical protein